MSGTASCWARFAGDPRVDLCVLVPGGSASLGSLLRCPGLPRAVLAAPLRGGVPARACVGPRAFCVGVRSRPCGVVCLVLVRVRSVLCLRCVLGRCGLRSRARPGKV